MIDGRALSILLVKNPAGANEVLRTLTLEERSLDLWPALNDGIADGRDVSWIWDADLEVLRGRVRRVTCSGTRAEEMALRLKYAGIDAPIAVERDLGRSLDAALRDRARTARRSTRCPPTRRCSSCATCWPTVAWPGGGRSEPTAAHRRAPRGLARRGVCEATPPTCGVWRALADEAGAGGVLDVGAGTGRVALDLAARGHRVTALDADPDLVGALAARARGRRLEVGTAVGDARSLALGRTFGLVILPMQVVQLLGGAEGRAGLLRGGLAHLVPGGVLAAALADPLEGVDPDHALPPLPDMGEAGGWVVSSAPVAVRGEPGAVLDRPGASGGLARAATCSRRSPRSGSTPSRPSELEEEAAALGFRVRPASRCRETGPYVGSAVVVLEAPS